MISSQNYIVTEGVQNDLPSQTVPDQSLTLRDLLVHYTRGSQLPESNTLPAFFDENAFIPNLKKLDLVELEELYQENNKNAQEANQKLKLIQSEQAKQYIDNLVAEKLKKAENQNNNIQTQNE